MLAWSDDLLTRLGAEDCCESRCGAIAAVGLNNRTHRLVAFWCAAVANAPCAAQADRVGSNPER